MSAEAKKRNAVNKALAALAIYHPFIPNGEIDAILIANGFTPLEEGIYCGRVGRVHEKVGPNTWFTMTWYKMEDSNWYEIVAYVS